MAEVQADAGRARSFVVHTEGVARNESHVFIFDGPSEKLVNIDRRR